MKHIIPDAPSGRVSTDTQPLDRAQIVCPPWCTDTGIGNGCEGEHSSEIATVPASGSSQLQGVVDRNWHAGYIPIVSVHAAYQQFPGEVHDDAPSVCLYVREAQRNGRSSDGAEINLRAHEARALIERLSNCLAMIEVDGA